MVAGSGVPDGNPPRYGWNRYEAAPSSGFHVNLVRLVVGSTLPEVMMVVPVRSGNDAPSVPTAAPATTRTAAEYDAAPESATSNVSEVAVLALGATAVLPASTSTR